MANGDESDTPIEIKMKRNHLAKKSAMNTVDEIDKMTQHNEVTLEAVNLEADEKDLNSPVCQSEVGSASKKCKSRRKISEDNNLFKEVVGAIHKATNRLAEVLLQCVNQSSAKDNELLEHLIEIGVEDDDKLLNAQTFLLENPIKMRRLLSSCTWPNYYNCCPRHSSALHAVVISPDYYLAPEHCLPAAMDDAVSAVKWLQIQALSNSLDPWLSDVVDFDRVFIVDDSSGGNLAYHLAVKLGLGSPELSPVKVRGYVLMSHFFCGTERTK
ncbi:alpha/beta hydrolase fold domain-containing protein [Forsythia ovata]|uniref:Alpha/beta hydrolase fold domain-containing protein n=1 Tax=Forsythia ovata TaxID=205694 RepID=A0ABD1RPG9_9LAMI